MNRAIGFHDKNKNQIHEGDTVQTFDKRGRKWVGTIMAESPSKIVKSSIVEKGGVQYMFKPHLSYGTWINNQEYASTLEIIKENR
jgi:hypothetical protein